MEEEAEAAAAAAMVVVMVVTAVVAVVAVMEVVEVGKPPPLLVVVEEDIPSMPLNPIRYLYLNHNLTLSPSLFPFHKLQKCTKTFCLALMRGRCQQEHRRRSISK